MKKKSKHANTKMSYGLGRKVPLKWLYRIKECDVFDFADCAAFIPVKRTESVCARMIENR